MAVEYLESSKIKVFPCTNRNTSYDINAKLMTEANFITLTKMSNVMKNRVINADGTSLSFFINGYYFNIPDFSTTYLAKVNDNTKLKNNLWAGIKVNSTKLHTNENTIVLANFENGLVGNLDISDGTVLKFKGIAFTTDEESDLSELDTNFKIQLTDNDGKAITATSIQTDELITETFKAINSTERGEAQIKLTANVELTAKGSTNNTAGEMSSIIFKCTSADVGSIVPGTSNTISLGESGNEIDTMHLKTLNVNKTSGFTLNGNIATTGTDKILGDTNNYFANIHSTSIKTNNLTTLSGDTISLNKTILPTMADSSTAQVDLGSSSNYFKNIWFNDLRVDTITTNTRANNFIQLNSNIYTSTTGTSEEPHYFYNLGQDEYNGFSNIYANSFYGKTFIGNLQGTADKVGSLNMYTATKGASDNIYTLSNVQGINSLTSGITLIILTSGTSDNSASLNLNNLGTKAIKINGTETSSSVTISNNTLWIAFYEGDAWNFTPYSKWGYGSSLSATNATISLKNREGLILNSVTVDKVAYAASIGNSDGPKSLGGSDTPLYLLEGAFNSCDKYAGGTLVYLNGTSKPHTTATFYAATENSTTAGYLLQSTTTEPTWVNPNTLSVSVANSANKIYVTNSTGAGTSGNKEIKLVSVLPATMEANTIYFVTNS